MRPALPPHPRQGGVLFDHARLGDIEHVEGMRLDDVPILCARSMPKQEPMIGPNGEKRPSNTIANALHVAKIATGEAEEVYVDESKRPGGTKGGRARAEALTPAQRQEIARKGAVARWSA